MKNKKKGKEKKKQWKEVNRTSAIVNRDANGLKDPADRPQEKKLHQHYLQNGNVCFLK